MVKPPFWPKKPLNVAGALNRDILGECPRLSRFETNGMVLFLEARGTISWNARMKHSSFVAGISSVIIMAMPEASVACFYSRS